MIKQVIRKAYWDVEKEENWLNHMASMGMALLDYSWCRYVFVQSQPNEYIYRIELLENHHNHYESIAYIQFLEENGIECVAKYMRWVYLRKRSCDGPFEMYTDMESRCRYYKRLSLFYSTLFALEFSAGLLNLVIGIVNGSAINIILSTPVFLLAALFAKLNAPIKMKIKKYSQEKIVRE
ncbi:MAG: DUF2812 domain-containing protein [Ruminiclostridium sp.]|nr:DUF2812 domain-containing protein [Ruminiclostridium sp.]